MLDKQEIPLPGATQFQVIFSWVYFYNYFTIIILVKPQPSLPENPCLPSPCGPYSQCRDIGGAPSCSCLVGYTGSAPNCRPECTVNSECQSNLACMREKCKDPCPGSCGIGAQCNVINHTPMCTCPEGYTGDPFRNCIPKPVLRKYFLIYHRYLYYETYPFVAPRPVDLCNPSPCGPNAQCNNGTCTCLQEYFGDPYRDCRPECVLNQDCPNNKACVNNKCKDPCIGVCGQYAECFVVNHIPTCTCVQGYSGDPFSFCRKFDRKLLTTTIKQVINFLKTVPVETHPCSPSPCGPNSQCREINKQAVCSCLPGFISSPPNCKPECIVSSECALNEACVGQKCIDPCPGTCGMYAICQVINHNPICSCPSKYTGDPFTRCQIISKFNFKVILCGHLIMQHFPVVDRPTPPPDIKNPCYPSPCGPNSQCTASPDRITYTCSCLGDYIGSPPNCRPECVSNSECPIQTACINQKCRDPCPGSCGLNAECRVVAHIPNCICLNKYYGDPFTICSPKPCKSFLMILELSDYK